MVTILTISGGAYTAVGGEQHEDGVNRDIIEKNDSDRKAMATPTLLSEAQSVIVNEGDTIKLPCMVDRLEGFVILWKKNNEIVTVASQIIDKVFTYWNLIDFHFDTVFTHCQLKDSYIRCTFVLGNIVMKK